MNNIVSLIKEFLDTPQAQSLCLDCEEDRKAFIKRLEEFLKKAEK